MSRVRLNVLGDIPASRRSPLRFSRRRAASLLLVHLLIGAHIVHWRIAGATLAPLELNESLHTIHLGIVTVGFVLLALVLLSVVVVGRFFCGWGCHILALQDACSWLLSKVGIRPRPVHSRVFALVPVGAMLYMFVWPQVARLIEGRPLPPLRVSSGEGGWSSFVTQDFWRNLPGPGIAILTFVICGAVMVYLLGSRSFCRHACPYGAIFALGERVAPGRVVLAGDCTGCGACTAACLSHIRVHEEVASRGKVVDPSCLRDLDCVAACPSNALQFGMTVPPLVERLTGLRQVAKKRRMANLTRGEEATAAGVFLLALLSFRGLYAAVPFLMSLGIATSLAWLAVLSVRLVRRSDVALSRLALKRCGRLTAAGRAMVVVCGGLALLTVHSAFIRAHEHLGWREPDGQSAQVASAIAHLETAHRFGLIRPDVLLGRLASLHQQGSAPERAEPYLRELLRRSPDDAAIRLILGTLLQELGRAGAAIEVLDHPPEIAAEEFTPDLRRLHARRLRLLGALRGGGEAKQSVEDYRRSLALEETGDAHLAAGRLLLELNRHEEALRHLERAVALDPLSSAARLYLGRTLEALNRPMEARQHLQRGASLARHGAVPGDMNEVDR